MKSDDCSAEDDDHDDDDDARTLDGIASDARSLRGIDVGTVAPPICLSA